MKKYLILIMLLIPLLSFSQGFIKSKKGFVIEGKSFLIQKEDTTTSTPPEEDTRIYILRCNTVLNCNSVIKKSTAFIDNFNLNYNNLSKEFKKEELYV